MSFVLPQPEEIKITATQADELIKLKLPSAALLYLYILRHGGAFSQQDAQFDTGLNENECLTAMERLRSIGLLAEEDTPLPPRVDEPPEYTAADVQAAIADDAKFKGLIENIQKQLGKILSSGDLLILFGIYDYIGLPPDVIMMLTQYHIGQTEKRYGVGRRPTMRTLEKEAYHWDKLQICSLDGADKYIKEMTSRDSEITQVKEALRLYHSGLTPQQERYITSWLDMGFKPAAIEIAYERTVNNTGRFTWGYADAIFKNWHKSKWHTPQEIEQGEALAQSKSSARRNKKSAVLTQPTSDEMQREIERMERQFGIAN